LIALFAATLWTAGFLLGSLLPMVYKFVLPRFGATGQVANACLFCLAFAAFAGYVYAHLAGKLRLSRQLVIHVIMLLLALLCLLPSPLRLPTWALVENNPVPVVLTMVAVVIGLPYLMCSATSPLLQRWFSFTTHPASNDPYFLYGASLFGETCGVLGYSFLIEPHVSLLVQLWLWAGLYCVLILLTVASVVCTFLLRANDHKAPVPLAVRRVGRQIRRAGKVQRRCSR